MMGIVVPKTCWAGNKICNKNLCCIQLAFYFHVLAMMYGQNHIKFELGSTSCYSACAFLYTHYVTIIYSPCHNLIQRTYLNVRRCSLRILCAKHYSNSCHHQWAFLICYFNAESCWLCWYNVHPYKTYMQFQCQYRIMIQTSSFQNF